MNEEEKKAIERFSKAFEYLNVWNKELIVVPEDKKYFLTVLNLLEKKDKEIQFQKEINKTEQNRHKQTEKSLKGQLKKKDKMIDLMAERLAEDTEWFYSEFDNYIKQDFIDYFTNKVEEDR